MCFVVTYSLTFLNVSSDISPRMKKTKTNTETKDFQTIKPKNQNEIKIT